MSKDKVSATLVRQDVEEFRRRRARIEEEAKLAVDRLTKEIESVRKLIRNGKATTGDRITDYFIVAHGYIDSEHAEPLRELEMRMAGKAGELFLVVRREKKRLVFGGPNHSMGPNDYCLGVRHTLGVLSGDVLVLDPKKQDFGLPTKALAELAEERSLFTKPGPLLFGFQGLSGLTETVSARHESGLALEVIIGDEAVGKYSPYRHIGAMAARPKHWVVALNSTARALGKKIPEAPEEIADREEKKKAALEALDEARHTYKRLLGQGPQYRDQLWNARKELSLALDRANGLGLKEEPLVLLVAKELKETS